jgi:hypothetical protein
MPGSALWGQGFWAAALPTSLPRPAAMPPIRIVRSFPLNDDNTNLFIVRNVKKNRNCFYNMDLLRYCVINCSVFGPDPELMSCVRSGTIFLDPTLLYIRCGTE